MPGIQTMTTPHPESSRTPSRGPHGTRRIAPLPESESQLSELARLLDQYLEDLQAGRKPDRAGLIAAHPELAPQLAEALDGLEFLHGPGAAGGATETPPPARLGDFRLIREVGRGGMGVVYEAEQVSLKRRVALKVLRAGAVADEVAMQRFQREAETVARLHHTNIVPIHAVGSEDGTRYYAMEFIEGRDLADVLEAARAGREQVSAEALARWGLQAADALAHAHARGVVHRDIKPSNLLLDAESRLWLTDFGLARRADDITLSLTGALLGTPRYMSPEQARAAAATTVDHRTDLYSLGATLYELATRRPIFEAATTHEVLSLILHQDPAAPRSFAPDLPRDLETIILKCLAKDPERRYATAVDLAADLRAFLEHRPIKARRPGLPERALRWARQHRRSLAVAGVSGATSMIVVALVLAGGGAWRQAQQAQLTLTTRQALLQAELLQPDRDEVAVPAFSLPTRQPVPIPSGQWRLRVSGPGQLSETHLLTAGRQDRLEFEVALANRLFEATVSVDTSRTVDLAALDADGADFIAARPGEIRRIDAVSGQEIWRTDLTTAASLPRRTNNLEQVTWSTLFQRDSQNRPGLLQPAPDLDQDGINDLVWSGGVTPSVLAVSGHSGQVLWWAPGYAPADARPASPRESLTIFQGHASGPSSAADLDGDGVPDIVSQFHSGTRRWVSAVSGRSGRTLWQRGLDAATFRAASSSGRADLAGARLGRVQGATVVFTPAGTRWLALDGARGGILFSNDLPGVILQQPRIGDLDGDGHDDVLFLIERGSYQRTLQAWSLAGRKLLWERSVDANFEPSSLQPETVDWPVVADLDHDGRAEVLLPARTPGSPALVGSTDQFWSGLTALDGVNGSPRWTRVLARGRTASVMTQADRFIVGPDLDGDGIDDIAAVTQHHRSFRAGDSTLHVDALSGRDGRSLWTASQPGRDFNDKIGRPVWWPDAATGRMRLVFSTLHWPARPDATAVVDATSGRWLHQLTGAFDPEVVDANGDGMADLMVCRTEQAEARFGHIRQVVRGTAPLAWSRLSHSGRPRAAGPDLDGDGIADLLLGSPFQAISGATGAQLWQSAIGGHAFLPLTGEGGDLDRDGVPDVIAVLTHTPGADQRAYGPISAVSGRDGRALWTAPISTFSSGELALAEARDLDGDRVPEILLALAFQPPEQHRPGVWSPANTNQLWLIVLNSRDGSLRWQQPMSDGFRNGLNGWTIAAAHGDLDGDGVLDIVAGALNAVHHWELRGWSGRDGRVLWTQPLGVLDPGAGVERQLERAPVPAIGDLDGDGRPEAAVIEMVRKQRPDADGGLYACTVRVLEGPTGALRWASTWTEHTDLRPPAPVFLSRGGDSGRGLAVLHRTGRNGGLYVHDAAGAQLGHLPTDSRDYLQPLNTADLDGDGRDELFWINTRRQLMVIRDDWRTPSQIASGEDLETVWPAAGNRPATIIVQRDNGVEGISGLNGRVVWRVDSAKSHDGRTTLLPAQAPARPRLVLPGSSAANDGSGRLGTIECRTARDPLPEISNPPAIAAAPAVTSPIVPATPGTAPGDRSLAAPGTSAGSSPPATSRDPRLARALPWNLLESGFGPQSVNNGVLVVVRSLVLQGALQALLLLAPAALVQRAWRRWSWRGGLPTLALAIGFWTMCFIGTGGTPGTIDGRIWLHLGNLLFPVPLGLPQIAFAVHVAGLIEQGDRRRLGRFLVFALVLALVAGGAWLLFDQRARQPGEYYTPNGAFWILAVGTYLAGLGPLGRGLWNSGRRVARRLLRREPTGGPDRPGGTPKSGHSADSARA